MATDTRRPEGVLVAIGGGEDRESGKRVLRRVTELAKGGADRVAVIPTASGVPEEMGRTYVAAFEDLGVAKVDVLDIRTREDARDEGFVRRVEEADVIFMTGGDQLRLTSILGGSPVLEAIQGQYRRGGVVAGTSAGAAAMSDTMIFEGEAASSLRKGSVQMTPGLGFIESAVLDTHFVDRGRFSRLLEAISTNPNHVGLGIGEDTAALIRGGRLVEVVGSGLVVVVDGHEMRHSNVSSVKNGRPIVVEHMIVHTLAAGYCYDLERQRYLCPDEREGGREREVPA